MSVHNHDEETIKKLQEQTAFDKKNRAKTSESGQGGVARNQVSPPSFASAAEPLMSQNEYDNRIITAYKERLREKVKAEIAIFDKQIKDLAASPMMPFAAKEFEKEAYQIGLLEGQLNKILTLIDQTI